MSGGGQVLIINKPKGPTSHDMVEQIRRKFPGQKVGHAGTLDPMASGVLIVLIGPATKRQKEFMNLEKEYEAEITLGVETDTYDGEGEVVNRNPSTASRITQKNVEAALAEFVGEIEQTVPPYSAVKVDGQKLYRLARRKKINEAELPRRRILIKKIELLDFKKGDFPTAKIRVICSKGTYIRSLARDLGRLLGCGAYLSELVRRRIGPYMVGDRGVEPRTSSLSEKRSSH